MTYTHYLGLDLGQARDYTAIVIVEELLWCPGGESLDPRAALSPGVQPGWLSRDLFYPAGVAYWEQRAARLGRPGLPPLALRHLERLPLGTSYVDQVAHVAALLARPELPAASTAFVVDATGCGRPVLDMLRQAGLRPTAITITAGTATHYDPSDGSLRVPKRDLVSAVAVVLEQRRLQVAAALPEAATLQRELGTFRRRVTRDGDDSYSSWREADHDDLVLATALCCWFRHWYNEHLDLASSQQERSVNHG